MDRPRGLNQEVEQFLWLFMNQCKMIGTNGYPLLSLPNKIESTPYMLIPVYDGHQNPQLGIELLRSHT